MALVNPTHERGYCSFAITGQLTHAAGESVGHIVNPEGVPIVITNCFVYVYTNSTGAANLTIGHAATVLAAHDLTQEFAAAAMAAAAGTAINGFANGDAADAFPVLAAGDVIVACTSADSSGLTARAYIEYVRV
jgi:type IV secretory pathway VirB6-like protein